MLRPMREGRLSQLDGLRGCAAAMVFLSHAACTLSGAAYAWAFHSPLRLFLDGEAAVDLFFVLSGFVLALPFLRGEDQGWAGFVARRALRLYPTHWVAFALAWIVSGLVLKANLNAWGAAYPQHSEPLALVEQVTLFGGRAAMDGVNPAIWTLAIEMQMALVFPLLVRALLASRLQGLAVLLGAVLLGFSLHFWPLPLFTLGAFVALWRPKLRHAALAGLLLYAVRAWVPAMIDHYGGHLVCGLGAALLVVAAAEGRLQLLQGRVAQLLGRLSYGFYLVHLPLLLLAVSWLPRWPLPLAWAVALVAALAVAFVLHRTVERPSQRLGRRVAARLARGGAVEQGA